jgi:hypothetical protein
VFAWERTARFPLCDHKNIWADYINIIKKNSNASHDFFLEFVKDDSFEQMLEDSKILSELLRDGK